MFNISELISDLIYTVPAIFIALSCHEFGHAYAAYKMGDLSQKENGRLTLNPFRHLDPAGTLCLLLFHVGWGKPVQVDPYFSRIKTRDDLDGSCWAIGKFSIRFCVYFIGWFASCVRISWCDCFLFTCIIPNNSGYEYWVRGI